MRRFDPASVTPADLDLLEARHAGASLAAVAAASGRSRVSLRRREVRASLQLDALTAWWTALKVRRLCAGEEA